MKTYCYVLLPMGFKRSSDDFGINYCSELSAADEESSTTRATDPLFGRSM